jgi:PhnB protein
MPHTDYSITPHLVVRNAPAAIDFYCKALGFTEVMRMPMPNGKILHCSLSLGSQQIMLCDDELGMGPQTCRSPQSLGGTTVTIHLNVPDIDTAFPKAIAAGAKVIMPVSNQFWGARYGKFIDPFGHEWSMATSIEDVSPQEMAERAEKLFSPPRQ